MKLTVRRVLPLAISALAIVLLGASNVPNLPMPSNAAMIYNAGTGDYAGFRIVVTPDGHAIAIDGAGHTSTQLESDVASKFFNDLASAGQLNQLSAQPCVADVNAPTTVEVNASITITWKGQHSPGLTCATDGAAQRLLLDATQIQHALYVQAYRKRNLITYGTAYNGRVPEYGGGGGGYYSYDLEPFHVANFQNSRFTMDQFYVEHFSNGITTSDPFGASPFTGAPTVSIPYTTPQAAPPWASIPVANPWANPYLATPFTSSPFSGLGLSSPYGGSGIFTTSTP